MRIAMVASSVSRAAGGIYEVERRLSLELSQTLNHEVAIFAGRDVHTDSDIASWLPLLPNAYPVYGPSAFGYAPGIRVGLNQWQADVAHLHMLWMYPSVAVNGWAVRSKKPYIITPHGMLDAWAVANSSWKKRLAYSLYEKSSLRKAACIHVLSEAEAEAVRSFGLKNPLAVIPNGIDLPEHDFSDYSRGNRKRRLLFLGRLHPKKGLLNLLQAWRDIQSSALGSEWILTIAGWSEVGHVDELKKRARELGLVFSNESSQSIDSPLEFIGPQFGSDKVECLKNCEAFVLPSLSEGLPMSVLEAWAYGKPVVMTPMCNLPEGTATGASLIVNPKVDSLKEGLTKLLQMTDAERAAMGQRGRELVESQFTWKSVGLRMEEVYQWLVKGGKAPSCVRF